MVLNCRRPLHNAILAKDFIQKVLGVVQDHGPMSARIANVEMTLSQLESHPTVTHEDYRFPEYSTPVQREQLYGRILNELINQERLSEDEEITLGKGGAKPADLKLDAQAYIVSGAPASGKSLVAVRLAEENGAYILDSDYAKRKFPEYANYPGGASLVHQESDRIIFDPGRSLYSYCVYGRCNIVVPLVGRTFSSVGDICLSLIDCGYDVHIINVVLDRYQCAARAYDRFLKTDRYVPLSYVFDEVGNEPERVYFLLKRAYGGHSGFKSFSQLSNDVEFGALPKIVEATDNSPISCFEPAKEVFA